MIRDARLEPWDGPFDFDAAAHLLTRAGFGASPDEIDAAAGSGLAATVAGLLTEPAGDDPATRRWNKLREMGPRMARRSGIEGMRALWLRRMLESPAPLREHLTLFWHDHFATGAEKVRDPVAMERQNAMLLERGTGRFDELLLDIARDPAMLVWLDNAASSRRHPNENFARELFELFSLGIGHYRETDIKAAARAFTGWQVNQGSFRFSAADHDDGPKTVLGVSGNLGGEDVVRACAERPACSRLIATKLYRWFVSAAVDEALEAALGEALNAEERRIGPFLGRLFSCRAFYADAARGSSIRSPVQLVVGTLRTLRARADVYRLAELTALMGEALYEPPTVAGWDRGRAWINSATLTARHNFAGALTAGEDGELKCRTSLESDPARLARALLRRAPPANELEKVIAGRTPLAVVGAALALPEAQLM